MNSSISLNNGLSLQVEDQSNRYFGDYHRVRLVVRCQVPVAQALAAPECELDAAQVQRLFGSELCYEKVLERMGVPGAAVETVRRELIEQFLAASRGYLERDDFSLRLLRQQFKARTGGGLGGRGR